MRLKRNALALLAGTTALCFTAFHPPVQDGARARLAAEIEHSIKTEMLNKWYPQTVDKQNGGFTSTYTYDWKQTGPQDKMIVTQARHIWSNAKAAQLYPDVAYYLSSAKHGVAFLRDRMWDKTNGGFYTLVDQQGNVKAEGRQGYGGAAKSAYGNAFAIYGLAAYYQASGDTSALNLAKKTFAWLEQHSHDPVHKGYFQALEKDGTPVQRTSQTPADSDVGYKDQNSSIHLLEAFTELYQVWPDPLVRERLQEMLLLVRDTIVIDKGYLTLFLTPDWKPVSFRDSTEDVIRKNHHLDEVSFGHDIETAYLMLEASHALGLEHDSKTMQVAKKMADHTIRTGFDNTVGGFYDGGYYFKGKDGITIIRDSKNWWAQAEGLNTLLLMSDLYPNDALPYYDLFLKQWEYIDKYIIDHEHGDWYPGGIDKEPKQKTALKAQIWKASYHQFRALANVVQRLRPDDAAPSIPQNLKAKTLQNALVMQWDKSMDNGNMLGYNVYLDGKKVGFTPLTSFSMPAASQLKGKKLTVKAVDLHGNQSAASRSLPI
ncbi:AGE family epimerase/isomerase [Pontibacter sp. E15-1]|uniref:AGE family epimerase/isomerase n=1 Tax=Pontibacter sp. E15-1 TaxID=2919918 RepID=UPI001F4FA55F|nr:AGE family epimerase/isomerase [Pontibacter sp. E15-1]MCJ8164063.1 AGE family epimerase/isomerase [Pontibacter sp. E15-1]